MRKRQVLIIGDEGEFPEKNDAALEIGKFIASHGWVLVTGGRGGIMQAASKGASGHGGIVLAILPSSEMSEANPYANIVIPTGIGFARNTINVYSCDVVVAIGGGSGTLSEIAYAWQANKPIIACSFVEGVSRDYAGKKLDYRRNDPILNAKSLNEVFDLLKKIISDEKLSFHS